MQTMNLRKNTASRDSNIELLRMLAMAGVVLLHYNNATIGGGLAYVAQGSWNHRLMLSLESIFICAVNVFVLITGFYNSESQQASVKKTVALLLQVTAFRLVLFGVDALREGEFVPSALLSAIFPNNWFVVLYIAMYLLSPYVNKMLQSISCKSMKNLVILCVILFSLWPMMINSLEKWLNISFFGVMPVSMDGDGRGYTLVQFLMMYLIGAWLHRANITLKKRWSLLVFTVCALLITLISTLDTRLAWAYNSPLVILEAVAAFLLLRQLPFRCKAVNFLAAGAFTCYLGHARFFWLLDIPAAVTGSPVWMLVHMLLSVAGIYLCCFVLYLVYSFLEKPLLRWIGGILRKGNKEYIRVLPAEADASVQKENEK